MMSALGKYYDGTPDPRKAKCNNCGSEVKYNVLRHPVALLITVSDSLGSEVFYCPNCGPLSPESTDGVTVVQ